MRRTGKLPRVVSIENGAKLVVRELALLVAEQVAEDLDVGAKCLIDPLDERQPVRFLEPDQRLGLILVEAARSVTTLASDAPNGVGVEIAMQARDDLFADLRI